MNILGLQETDWLTRGPHTQHHIFERLSKNSNVKITILDYDIDKILKLDSLLVKKQIYSNIHRAVKDSHVLVVRTAHIQVPYLRRISSLITNFFGMLKLFRENRPDIILGFSITNGFIGLILAKLFRIPYIFYYIDLLHTLVSVSYAQYYAKLLSDYLFKKSDCVIVVTKFLQSYVINEGAPPKNVHILLNGISLENTIVNREKLEKLKHKLSIRENDFVLLYLGYLYDFAGLKEIIDYYNADVKSGKLNIKFLIVGDGEIYNRLINHVKEINADWVILTGKVPFFEITEYIELSNLCLMSFELNNVTKDITPVKVMEYMAMKKPVLSTSLPSIVREIGKNNGVIFAQNQKELVEKIRDLTKEKEKLKNLGLQGYELIKKHYMWPNILKDLKKIMLDLIKEKKQLS
ncbi:MAG: glycosyltransferase [Candidatus Lokiarchaeota archaeon]|nr:glycosyltransferase [Candidatus Lokiarchaeota archaeon]